jgi:hypothetical protein
MHPNGENGQIAVTRRSHADDVGLGADGETMVSPTDLPAALDQNNTEALAVGRGILHESQEAGLEDP